MAAKRRSARMLLALVASTIVVVVGTSLVQGVANPQGAETQQHRVVFHVNSGDEKIQKGALNNIAHLYQELGRGGLRVELVAHGVGLSLLTKRASKFGADLARLKQQYGVAYTACSNTMKAQNLTRADLLAEVDDTVPAVVRLMERQEQGWAYIKP